MQDLFDSAINPLRRRHPRASTLIQGPRLLQPLLLAVEIPNQLVRIASTSSGHIVLVYLILKMLPASRHPAKHYQIRNSVVLIKNRTFELQDAIAYRGYRGKVLDAERRRS